MSVVDNMYDEHWLIQIMVELRAANHIVSEFWIGEDDPEDILYLKKELSRIKHELQELEFKVYGMKEKIINEQNKEKDRED